MLLAALATLPLAWAISYNDSTEYSSGSLGDAPTQSYYSSNYTPVAFNFSPAPSAAVLPGYLFLAPRGTTVAQPGARIYDSQGGLIWDGSAYGETVAFKKATYMGQEVLTIWVGQFIGGGVYGDGYGLVLDNTYAVIANISTTLPNASNDFHDLQITDDNTAIIPIYAAEQRDLSEYNVAATDGGQGWIFNNYVQEINVTSGEALFTWSSLDHIQPSQSYADAGGSGTSEAAPWDYFHLNSIEKDDSGNYLVSSRHCHAIYYISGSNGTVLWTLNGKNSSFSMGDGTDFQWQHHARWHGYSQMSLFDNAASTWTSSRPESRGILLNMDMNSMTVTLTTEALPPTNNLSQSQGNVEIQSNGNMLIGWGSQPWISEHDSTGNILWAAQLGAAGVQNYRALRANWTAYPSTSPNISVITNSSTSSYDVYASWNGATEVAYWVLGGANSTSGNMTSLTSTNRTDFETALTIDQSSGVGFTYLQAVPMDASGSALGYSEFVALDGSTTVAAASSQTATISKQGGFTTGATTTGTESTSSTSTASTSTAAGAGAITALPMGSAGCAMVVIAAVGLGMAI